MNGGGSRRRRVGTSDLAVITYWAAISIESHHGLTTIRAELDLGVLGSEIVFEMPTAGLLRALLGEPS